MSDQRPETSAGASGDGATPSEAGAAATCDVVALLRDARAGDRRAWERLLEIVHDDLRRIAHLHLRRRASVETLQTTALVNETYLRLARPATADLADRAHFLAIASRAMRQILIDRARARAAAKRGEPLRLDLERIELVAPERGGTVLALEEALRDLEHVEPRLGQVVEMRFFGGMTFEEAGTALGVSDRTVKSDWRRARAFLEARLVAAGVRSAD